MLGDAWCGDYMIMIEFINYHALFGLSKILIIKLIRNCVKYDVKVLSKLIR